MIQACLNGARTRQECAGVPITPEELAADAQAIQAAGATEIHCHPRSADGSESLLAEHMDAAMNALRAAVPRMPIGISSGDWIHPGHARRLAAMTQWQTRPDYASVNLNEPDCLDTMATLQRLGIGIEAGIWTQADAQRFVKECDANACLRILLELQSPDPAEATEEYHAIVRILDNAGIDRPLLLHGLDGSAWSMIELAHQLGHDTRVGFEDCLNLPDGRAALTNADMVSIAAAMKTTA